MIIVCPACGARYEVEDALILRAGRAVRCSACDAEWTVWPQDPVMGAPAAPLQTEPSLDPATAATRFSPLEAPDGKFAASLEAADEAEGGRGGFVWGFVAAAAVALGATLLYARHAEIAAAAPQLAGEIDAYVAAVDALRARLAELAAGLLDR